MVCMPVGARSRGVHAAHVVSCDVYSDTLLLMASLKAILDGGRD